MGLHLLDVHERQRVLERGGEGEGAAPAEDDGGQQRAGGGGAQRPGTQRPRRTEPREDPKPRPAADPKETSKSGAAKLEETAAAYGIKVKTAEGKRICGWGFREGACTEPCRRGNAHVCHFCLDPGHRTIHCPSKPAG